MNYSNKININSFCCKYNIFKSVNNNNKLTERGGSVVTHETRIREVPGSNTVAGQPGSGF